MRCPHRELIRPSWEAFEQMAKPRVVRFAANRAAKSA
jgi:hypothetical protein